uniref:Reverse transcriptase n=1 Tax=Triops cancriformis TaxID=194544 RepID=C6F3W3_TRICB|nr:reverse transcriptase [Triops cancriformis]
MSQKRRPEKAVPDEGATAHDVAQPDKSKCSVCGETFKGPASVTMHMVKKHPVEFNELKMAKKPVPKKVRWSEEEIFQLARTEAELTLQGVRFINVELQKIFPAREIEGIKGQRKLAKYKELVKDQLDEIGRAPNPPEQEIGEDVPSPFKAWLELLLALPKTPNDFLEHKLDNIIVQALKEDVNSDQVFNDLNSYLKLILEPSGRAKSVPGEIIHGDPSGSAKTSVTKAPKPATVSSSRKKRRDAEFARIQRLYRKNRTSCINTILDGNTREHEAPKNMEGFWREIFERESPDDPDDPDIFLEEEASDIWKYISFYEMCNLYPPPSTAPGPDGFSSKDLRRMTPRVLNKILNLLLHLRDLPQILKSHRTVLIPKTDLPTKPGDFRPITISNILVRHLNKILANRVSHLIPINERQKAFLPIDGCAENIFTLDFILHHARTKIKSLSMAILDISKAFDSVSHHSIFRALREARCPIGFIKFIENCYGGCFTKLFCGGVKYPSEVSMNRGVKQGDPLSPVLFNLVIDGLIRQIPSALGFNVSDQVKVSCIAYADDLILIATTRAGLKTLLDLTNSYLAKRGLSLNPDKCSALSIVASGKQKLVYIASSEHFDLAGQKMRNLNVGDSWRYLGIQFSHLGRAEKVTPDLTCLINRLQKAPLKLQQKLYALRIYLIPRLIHGLTLSKTNLGELKTLDKLIRKYIRAWLHLPDDTPMGYFYTPLKAGGLGLPSLRLVILNNRLERILRMKASQDIIVRTIAESETLGVEIRKLHDLLSIDGTILDTSVKIHSFWAERLYSSYDGKCLCNSANFPPGNKWIGEDSLNQRSHIFADCLKLRINALPTRSRTARGRPLKDKPCRAGCRNSDGVKVIETLNHITQVCERTHGARVKRHDRLVDFAVKGLQRPHRVVLKEPHYKTVNGVRKPDIVIKIPDHTYICDFQVVSDTSCLELEFRKKALKYAEDKGLCDQLTRDHPGELSFTAITFNTRGLIAKSSVTALRKLGMPPRSIMTLQKICMEGSLEIWRIFNQTTAMARN